MLINTLISVLISHWLIVFVIALTSWLLRNKYGYKINKYPGPALAGFTNWWRFLDVLGRKAEHTHMKLHRELGDVVRLGPNVLSFADPAVIKDIYGLNKGFYKSEFYPVQNNVSKGVRIQSLFSTTDETYHAQLRRRVNSAFAMTSLLSYEPLVDVTTEVFLKETRKRFVETSQTCDFARWLQMYAFDVIGQMSFSKRLGFLESFEDVDGIMKAIAAMLDYAAPIGQQPWLDRYFINKNPIKMFLMKWGLITSSNPVAAFATKRSAERRAEIEKLQETLSAQDADDLQDQVRGVDFLTRFIMKQKSDPEFMTDMRVLTVVTSLINAGSDTTACALSSVFYYVLKHPSVYQKLMEEIDQAVKRDIISGGKATNIVTWPEAQKLPYLDAVIQESFRMCPPLALLLERHVPAQGATIGGEHIPGGTIVGCNAFVLHRREEVFGSAVDTFRPERWLEASPEQLSKMKATMFQFGAGARTCIGKNISLLEVYKLVPTVLREFEIELADPTKEWTTLNCWFVRPLDFNVRFKQRVRSELAM